MSANRLIVLEGLDGSGKTTQFERLKDMFGKRNMRCRAISFPDYDKPSSALVKMYLAGEFSSDACDVNAYAASSFYAVDRYASYKLYWEKDYTDGTVILAARYVTSNAIYQMTKLPQEKWNDYLDWLCDYEYVKLGLPRPDTVIFLDMPIEVSQKLMTDRYDGDEQKKDIHEADIAFLEMCRRAALYAAEKQDWKIVSCADNGKPLPIERITEMLEDIIFDDIRDGD